MTRVTKHFERLLDVWYWDTSNAHRLLLAKTRCVSCRSNVQADEYAEAISAERSSRFVAIPAALGDRPEFTVFERHDGYAGHERMRIEIDELRQHENRSAHSRKLQYLGENEILLGNEIARYRRLEKPIGDFLKVSMHSITSGRSETNLFEPVNPYPSSSAQVRLEVSVLPICLEARPQNPDPSVLGRKLGCNERRDDDDRRKVINGPPRKHIDGPVRTGNRRPGDPWAYAPEVPGLYLYSPSRSRVSPALKAFVEVARILAKEQS